MEKNFKEIRVVAGAIFQRGQMLVALRSERMSSPMLWELPGGKVEKRETDQAALKRELREELGVVVMVKDPLAKSRITVGTRKIDMHVYYCELQEGIPTAKEHAELRWIKASQIESLRWAPADVPLIPDMIQWLSGK